MIDFGHTINIAGLKRGIMAFSLTLPHDNTKISYKHLKTSK